MQEDNLGAWMLNHDSTLFPTLQPSEVRLVSPFPNIWGQAAGKWQSQCLKLGSDWFKRLCPFHLTRLLHCPLNEWTKHQPSTSGRHVAHRIKTRAGCCQMPCGPSWGLLLFENKNCPNFQFPKAQYARREGWPALKLSQQSLGSLETQKRQNQFFRLNVKNFLKRKGKKKPGLRENKENTKVSGRETLTGAWREVISVARLPREVTPLEIWKISLD